MSECDLSQVKFGRSVVLTPRAQPQVGPVFKILAWRIQTPLGDERYDVEPSDVVLRAFLAAAPDALIVVDVPGKIIFVNDQAESLFGWTAVELVGQQVEALVPGAVGDQHIHKRVAYLADPGPRPMGVGRQLFGMRKDGSTFPADISLNIVTNHDGKPLVLAAVRDIHERIELEADRTRRALDARREQTYRLESLGQLAGGIAHDFNNLLGVILNYVTLLSRHVDDQMTKADLGEIKSAAERGATLTRRLLTFARRDQADRTPLDVNAVVHGVASILERSLGEEIELRLILGESPVHAVCDRDQLEQILLTLAANARDAMPDGGVLTIEASVDGDAASPMTLLNVVDTGHGMPPDVAARAFEPFFSTKAHGRGSGLGLATVYGIVRQNEGTVNIASTVNEGTTVTVRLPGADRTGTEARVEGGTNPTDAGRGALGNERILLVEDEVARRLGTTRLLTDAGYDVVARANGIEALEYFDSDGDQIDVVVTDIAMPQMRGDELASQLKRRSIDVPVIFMTGYDSGGAPLTGRIVGKPVLETHLLEALREVLDD